MPFWLKPWLKRRGVHRVGWGTVCGERRTMKSVVAVALAAVLAMLAPVHASEANPVQKVVQMLSDLETKIVGEGKNAQKIFMEFSSWCEDRSKKVGYEIKTGKAQAAALKAAIAKQGATEDALEAKIEELSGSIATDEADLKAATFIREKEHADFVAEESEASEVIDMLQRAIGILQREMSKHGASMLQLQGASSVAQALRVLVDAAALSSSDATQLTALVQSSEGSDDRDSGLGAPDPAVYKGHSDNIIETLQGVLDKATEQLDSGRKMEVTNEHNFQMLEQSLKDEIEFDSEFLDNAKKGLAGAKEAKATAEGELAVTSADLSEDTKTLATLHHDCLTGAQDFEAATKSRAEELKALAEAKKAISENTAGAETVTYGLAQVSLLQLARLRLSSGVEVANLEVVRFMRDLARKQGSAGLAQLASRMASAISSGIGSGKDPFVKVKGLISDMIERLEAAAGSDASHKAYCDRELAETRAKKDDHNSQVDKMSASIGQMTANSARLKEEVAILQQELADLAASQAKMDKLRQEEHTAFVSDSADMEQGLKGIKLALNILP